PRGRRAVESAAGAASVGARPAPRCPPAAAHPPPPRRRPRPPGPHRRGQYPPLVPPGELAEPIPGRRRARLHRLVPQVALHVGGEGAGGLVAAGWGFFSTPPPPPPPPPPCPPPPSRRPRAPPRRPHHQPFPSS